MTIVRWILVLLLAVPISFLSCLPARAAGPDPAGSGTWTGLFLGGDVGLDLTSSGIDQEGSVYNFPTNPAFTTGFEYGFLYETPVKLVLGVDGYGTFNFGTDHSVRINRNASLSSNFGTNVFGADIRVGYDFGHILPYAMIGGGVVQGTGDAATLDGAGVHAGLGVDILVARYVGVFGEWSIQQASANAGAFGFPNGTANFLINNLVGGVSFYLWLPGLTGPF
jgi:hypothetical protein